METNTIIDNKFFDTNSRNTQLEQLIKAIGGVKILKSKAYKHDLSFIYNKDRTEHKLHFDSNDGKVYGLSNAIKALNSDNTADNYLIRLSPVLINGADPSNVYSLFIIDLDAHGKEPTGIEVFKEKYQKQFEFPQTFHVRTKRGGYHLYYYIDIRDIRDLGFNKKIGFEDGIDLLSSMNRGDLQTTIGPGSQHYDPDTGERQQYSIGSNRPIQPLPKAFIEYLKVTYADTEKELKEAREAAALASKSAIKEDEPQNVREAEAYVNKIIMEALESRANEPGSDPFKGKRNDKLNAVAYRLSSFGLSLGKMKELLQQINTKAFISPLEDFEFNRTAESAYGARVNKAEAYENAQHTIPEFPPYQRLDGVGERAIGYDEIIERLNAKPKLPLKELLKSEAGIKYFADTCVIASGTIVQMSKKRSESIFIEANEMLNSNRKLNFGDISRLLDKIELHFQVFTQESKFCLNVGPVPHKEKGKRGRASNKITTHPMFEARVTSGLRKDFIRPSSNNIIEQDIFHQVAPPPIADFPTLSAEEMKDAEPIIKEVIEHFRDTITDPTQTEEIHFIVNRIAAMLQRKQNVPNFVVLFGPGGTGKSTFLQFLSLFFASTDRLNASKFEDITGRFSNPGELTVLDDCNLAKATQWDTIKSLVSASEITIEEKGGPTVNIRKHINMFMCTNKKIPEIEKLSDRRMYLVKGHPVYTGDQYLTKLDRLTRLLLANDLFGLRAMYQYFLNYNVTISDWNVKSQAQKEMITEMSSYTSTLGGVSAIIQSDKIQQQKNEERHKYRKLVLNAIANFGYIHEDSGFDRMKLKLMNYGTQTDKFLVCNIYDISFMMNYYNALGTDVNMNNATFFATMKDDMAKKLTTLTKSFKHKTSVFSEVIGPKLEDFPDQKLSSKDRENRSAIGQKRKMILPPICEWLDRCCFLVGDSMSTQISHSFLADHGLEDIVHQILHWHEDQYSPSMDDCEEALLRSFPEAELGKFDLTSEIGEVSSFEFETKEEEKW